MLEFLLEGVKSVNYLITQKSKSSISILLKLGLHIAPGKLNFSPLLLSTLASFFIFNLFLIVAEAHFVEFLKRNFKFPFDFSWSKKKYNAFADKVERNCHFPGPGWNWMTHRQVLQGFPDACQLSLHKNNKIDLPAIAVVPGCDSQHANLIPPPQHFH